MRKLRNDRRRLQHILDLSARAMREYAALRGQQIADDDLRYDGFVRLIQTIGEACRKLSPELRAVQPHVPWADIIGLRNILVHDYDEIDEATVWRVLADELPILHKQATQILTELPVTTDE